MKRFDGKSIANVFALFLSIQILIILWRYMVLAPNGFSDYIFASVSVASIIGSFLLSVLLISVLRMDKQGYRGYGISAFASILSYCYIEYILKKNVYFPRVYRVIGFILFTCFAELIWILLQRIYKKKHIFIDWFLMGAAIISFAALLFIHNPVAKAILFVLFVLAAIYIALLKSVSKGESFIYSLIIFASFAIFAWFTGKSVAQYGKNYIQYAGERCKVVYNDERYNYCIKPDGERIAIVSEWEYD